MSATAKKPRWVVSKRGSGGATRWYWRPRDEPDVALGTDRFLAWQQADELNAARDARRAGRAAPPRIEGTIKWLVRSYLASPYFREKAARTQHGYQRHAEWMIAVWGDLSCETITPRAVQSHKQAGADTPWETNAQLRFVSLVFEWGRKQGLVESNPASRFGKLRTPPRSVMWEPAEIAVFLKDGTPSMRLAVAMGLYTLQREGDLIAMPWSAVSGGRFQVRQSKTGKVVAAQLHPALQAALDATSRTAVQILVCEATGRPYGEDHFRHVFAYDRARLGLRRELQFRDLRRTGAVTLARLGRPVQQIAALAGWELNTTLDILKVYVPLDEHMATSAIQAWGGVGTDRIIINQGDGIGGSGDDTVTGNGRLYGDEGPGLAHHAIGNDVLASEATPGIWTTMDGGLGHDLFIAGGTLDGGGGVIDVLDFTPGEDLIAAVTHRPGLPDESSAQVFDRLDANDDGLLNWQDSLPTAAGAPGAPVFTDGQILVLGLSPIDGAAQPTSEDWLVVRGHDGTAVTQLTQADWVMA